MYNFSKVPLSLKANTPFLFFRVRLNQRHRENVRRAVARRLAEQEEHAESQMQYYGEIETARFSDDESVLDPELQWIM